MSIFEIEKLAMCGEKESVLKIVSYFREYRKAVLDLINDRHSDGEVDSCTMNLFMIKLQEMEQQHTESK